MRLEDVGRALSHALRHEPWVFELELDNDGWVSIDSLLTSFREQSLSWRSVDRSTLREIIESSPRPRYEMVGDRIRALHGTPGENALNETVGIPPSVLFFGTSDEGWALIQQSGLTPSGRDYVHLPIDRETAVSVGRRKSWEPVILTVDAARAHADGVTFRVGNDAAWVADAVPAAYFSVSDDGASADQPAPASSDVSNDVPTDMPSEKPAVKKAPAKKAPAAKAAARKPAPTKA